MNIPLDNILTYCYNNFEVFLKILLNKKTCLAVFDNLTGFIIRLW